MLFVQRAALFTATLLSSLNPVVARGDINLYWGQSGTDTLSEVCRRDGVNFISLAFVTQSPEIDSATGLPGMQFAAHCSGVTYTVNGHSSNLLSDCTQVQEGIPVCQALGVKVILSIGGVFDASLGANYTVSTVEHGIAFADFMWNAFGPPDESYTGPRPFDSAVSGPNSVDGFDFDIEIKFPDQSPWIAMIKRLREYFGQTDRKYYITGAPQCPILVDRYFQMKEMIARAQFDILWIQFYNNDGCDGNSDGFNFDDWEKWLSGTASAHASLWIGLPAYRGPGYLNYTQLSKVLNVYGTRPYFGGVMLWDAWWSDHPTNKNQSYVSVVKDILATVTLSPTSTVSSPPSSTPTSCANPYIVKAGDYCYDIAVSAVTTVDQILELNPELNSFCDLTVGQLVCLPPRCTQTYAVQPGDSCYAIEQRYDITYTQLQHYNPDAFNADCTNLQVGQVLCVSISNDTATTTATTTTTQASIQTSTTSQPTSIHNSTRTSTQTSIPTPPPCGKTYTVKSGDSCYSIDQAYGITYAELQALNPGAFDSQCLNLYVGQELCVAALQTTTSTLYF